ncbi:MAG: acetolactate synthase small subunit [Chloroflexota bacterium]
MTGEKHTLVALVVDRPGVMSRVSSLFRRRGFNIEKIAVGAAETPQLSRMTIQVLGTESRVEQVRKQLEKLVDVVKVADLYGESAVARELALVRVKATPENRSEIIQIANIFRAAIVDVAGDSLVIEITGDEEKIDSFLSLVRGYTVKEIARTGVIALIRGGATPLVVNKAPRRKPKKE